MASKRIVSSTVDWAEFAKKIPAAQKASFNAIKNKTDGHVRKISALPENLPKIDFAHYKNKISVPGMVDDFQKKWEALQIPYPKDNLTSKIDSEAVSAKASYEKLVADSKAKISATELLKKDWEAQLPLEEMNREEALEAVPWLSIDVKNPTHFPHVDKKIRFIDLEARKKEA